MTAPTIEDECVLSLVWHGSTVLGVDDHVQRIIDWAEHLKRPRNKSSLASLLYSWRNADWLQQRRRDPLIGPSQRLGTRRDGGPIFRRWDESCEYAKAHCRS